MSRASLHADRHAEEELAVRLPELEAKRSLTRWRVLEIVRLAHAHDLARPSRTLLLRGEIEAVLGERTPERQQRVVRDGERTVRPGRQQ